MKGIKFNVRHKVRFDRGRVYYSYLNSIITAFLVWIFSSGNWVESVISAFSVFVLIYLLGYLDQKFNVLQREQKIYSEENPVIMEILKEIKKLNNEIKCNNHLL